MELQAGQKENMEKSCSALKPGGTLKGSANKSPLIVCDRSPFFPH